MRRARTATTSRSASLTRLATVGALAAVGTATLAISATAETNVESDVEAPVRTVTVSATDVVALTVERSQLAEALTEALEVRVALTATEPEPEPEPEPTPEPTPTATAEPAPTSEPSTSGPVSVATWDRVAQCESGGNWSINTGNGYYGGLQFNLNSWQWVGGSGYPHQASKAEQIHRANLLWERQGWNAWPSCSRQLGLR